MVNPSAVPGLTRRVGVAAVAGVAGGIVMGMPMAMMGMLPMIGGLVGSDSAVTGGIVHMVISAIIGAIYGLAIGGPAATYANGWWMGLAYGVIWWVLGPLLIMPGMMGMGPQFGMALSGPMLLSLVAHMMYGVVTGLAYPFLLARAR
ncbi:MAG: hypothetical protein EPO26_15480 [Chloroflexota bacterium]|nr:MAG: hypothetical protein EPO26_15480 [Chloroflexota bacterium]